MSVQPYPGAVAGTWARTTIHTHQLRGALVLPSYQPARIEMHRQRWSVPQAAAAIDVPRGHLYNAVTGRTPPSEAVRERLPELLGKPLDELFDAATLARTYAGPRGRAVVMQLLRDQS